MDSQAARLALVLHCLADPGAKSAVLDQATMEGALELAGYFRAHARRVLPAFGAVPSGNPLARRVLSALEDAGGLVTTTEIHHRLGNGANAAELRAILKGLEVDGVVESNTVRGRPGPPATEWRLVPGDVDGDDGDDGDGAPAAGE